MIVQAASPQELGWICSRTGCVLTPGARGIKAVDYRGIILGMVAYDGWTPSAVQAHMAVDSPIVWRHLLGPAFSYPFEECGKGLLLAVIPGDNAKSLHLAKHFGFREAYRVRDGWAEGVDQVLLEMRREDCQWLQRKAA